MITFWIADRIIVGCWNLIELEPHSELETLYSIIVKAGVIFMTPASVLSWTRDGISFPAK